ncbi:MAG: hypothetical protein ACE1ZW_00250 [Nitrospirales bacterium]
MNPAFRTQIILVLGFLVFTHPEMSLAQLSESSGSTTSQDSQHLTLYRTDLNVPVTLIELEETLAESSILATLTKGQRLSFYDVSLTALTHTTLLLQAKPSVLIAAVLVGEIQVQDETAEAGEAMAWPLGEEDIQVVVFDARSFLATSPVELSPDTKANLEEVAQNQERLKFWGLLEHVNLNLTSSIKSGSGKPGSGASARHQYLGNLVVLQLIRQYPEVERLRRGVAEAFVDALRTRDLQTVEWLISPLLFVNNIDQLDSSDWIVVRQDFAFLIMVDHWATPFAEAQLESSNDVSSWVVTTPSHRYRLWLEPFDGMIFVTAFETMDEGSEGLRE